MAQKPIAYEGNQPYVFVSYAHKDDDKVYPLIEKLQQKGFRIWYDSGIKAGDEWPEYIASHIERSSCVLICLSQNAADSTHCRQEITFAIGKHINILTVHLTDNVTLPSGLQMQLGNNQALFRSNFPTLDKLADEIAAADGMRPCRGYGYTPSRPAATYRPAAKSRKPFPVAKLVLPLVIAAVVGLGIWLATSSGIFSKLVMSPEDKYTMALQLIEEGKHYEAYQQLLALGEYGNSQQQLQQIRTPAMLQKASSAQAGDTVVWGSYEQDNNTSNGKEDITWIVLKADGGRLLLISEKGLDSRCYHEDENGASWKLSDMRSWLNNEFYNDAFTYEEQQNIFLSHLTTVGSDDTNDSVFLLSLDEYELYTGCHDNMALTDYAISRGAKDSRWWLRNNWELYAYVEPDWANYVRYDKESEYSQMQVDEEGLSVRPAIWLDLRDVAALEASYNNALQLMEESKFREAQKIFETLGDYQDSLQYLSKLPALILAQPYAQAKIGDTVTFGNFEWTVIAKENGGTLLLCTDSVKKVDYHGYTLAYPGWGECTLREWLNEDFLTSSAFGLSEDEMRIIAPTQVTTPDNPTYGTTGGAVSTDRIFLLSYDEVMQYLPSAADRILYVNGTPGPWWMRTKGETTAKATFIDTYGTADLAGAGIFQLNSPYHVRPALWIDCSASGGIQQTPPADTEIIG